ncbi:Sucrose transport protein [Entamoeba marina]
MFQSVSKHINLLLISGVQCGVDLAFFITWFVLKGFFGLSFQCNDDNNSVNWEYIVYYLLGIIIGGITQPLFGVLSDNCSSRFGRRRIFICFGIFMSCIGVLLTSILTIFYKDNDENTLRLYSIQALVLIGCSILLIGSNIIQVCNKALMLDIVDSKDIDYATYYFTVSGNISKIIYCIIGLLILTYQPNLPDILTFNGMIDNSFQIYTILFFILIIPIEIIMIIPLWYVSTEVELLSSSYCGFISDFIEAFKQLPRYIIIMMIVILCGFISYVPFTTKTGHYLCEYYSELNSDVSIDSTSANTTDLEIVSKTYIACYLSHCIFSLIYALIIPHFTQRIGRIPFFIISFLLAAISFILLCIPEMVSYLTSLTSSAFTPYYPIILIGVLGMATVELESMPYAILQRTIQEDQYGIYCGLLNLSVVGAEFCSFFIMGLSTHYLTLTSWSFIWAGFFALISTFFSAFLHHSVKGLNVNEKPRFDFN